MRPSAILGRIAPLLLLLVPALGSARVGEVLFVYGNAWVESAGGGRSPLVKGGALEEGDRLVTGSNGRLQVRMDDGGLLVLRPLSELVIEQFRYPAADAAGSAATQTPRSLMSLVRGGLRAITGTLGKSNPEAYEMRTPVATIGIRGTDYSALYCGADCADLSLDPGLYVGVAEGAIHVSNVAGRLDLGRGEYGYVHDEHSAPVVSQHAGSALALANQAARATEGYANPPRPDAMDAIIAQGAAIIDATHVPELPIVVVDGSDDGLDLTTGALGGMPLAVAGALGEAFSAITPAGASEPAADASGNLVAFSGATSAGPARVEHHGGVTLDAGRDGDRANATGLQWGRWSGGTAVQTSAGTTHSRSLERESMHWIVAGTGPQPALPSSGHANFELIGNTNPTDDAGHTGTLGSAHLGADFTAGTVDAKVKLSFAETGQVWKASARDLPMNVAQASFAGAFDDVSVHDHGAPREGAGSMSGFFTGDPQGSLAGAAMSYGLTDGLTNVAGTAAFQRTRPGS
jgi:hypothetical protein